ncbi:glucosaminidase domain-containing protein [Saccharospirillum impatiens]|jgi:Bax protein|uniref:glucosaminidase domain-containing protein n=1 Tax=Saccharospirillum impatiens TaxID=169438 RepID=UPI0003FD0A38|nr:glucosaminidase domain-containing protein [Saccharospirillum impatiens]
MNKLWPLAIVALMFIVAPVVGLWLPLGASKAPDFTEFAAGDARKTAFFDFMVPLVKQENEAVLSSRARLLALQEEGSPGWAERRWLMLLAERYELDEFDPTDAAARRQLIRRVDAVPASIALAQSANESAWGTSRFALQGNNYFGQWCFVRGCGLVPEARNEGASHEVAAFDSARESVRRYMNNINTHNAYADLRARRASLRNEGNDVNGLALAPTLLRYSERGQEYVNELQAMIRGNALQQYD